jgi:hypothetical protein
MASDEEEKLTKAKKSKKNKGEILDIGDVDLTAPDKYAP